MDSLCSEKFEGGFLNAITGSGGVKIDIRTTPMLQQQLTPGAIVPMDHFPSWKLHKNPSFWCVKHPNGQKLTSAAPVVTAFGNLQEVQAPIFAYCHLERSWNMQFIRRIDMRALVVSMIRVVHIMILFPCPKNSCRQASSTN
jgi:hypothetical protein